MERFRNADEKILLGYEFLMKERPTDACDVWLEAWEDIKQIISDEKPRDIECLQGKYDWSEYVIYYVQDLEMHLGRAAKTKKEYLQKRIKYCEEMLRVVNEDNTRVIENTQRAIAESYDALGAAGK